MITTKEKGETEENQGNIEAGIVLAQQITQQNIWYLQFKIQGRIQGLMN
jgi:hypothetical protein